MKIKRHVQLYIDGVSIIIIEDGIGKSVSI